MMKDKDESIISSSIDSSTKHHMPIYEKFSMASGRLQPVKLARDRIEEEIQNGADSYDTMVRRAPELEQRCITLKQVNFDP